MSLWNTTSWSQGLFVYVFLSSLLSGAAHDAFPGDRNPETAFQRECWVAVVGRSKGCWIWLVVEGGASGLFCYRFYSILENADIFSNELATSSLTAFTVYLIHKQKQMDCLQPLDCIRLVKALSKLLQPRKLQTSETLFKLVTHPCHSSKWNFAAGMLIVIFPPVCLKFTVSKAQ